MVRSTHAYLFDGEKRNSDQLRRLRQHVEPSWILTTASSSSLALVCYKNKTRTISRYHGKFLHVWLRRYKIQGQELGTRIARPFQSEIKIICTHYYL